MTWHSEGYHDAYDHRLHQNNKQNWIYRSAQMTQSQLASLWQSLVKVNLQVSLPYRKLLFQLQNSLIRMYAIMAPSAFSSQVD